MEVHQECTVPLQFSAMSIKKTTEDRFLRRDDICFIPAPGQSTLGKYMRNQHMIQNRRDEAESVYAAPSLPGR